ncbi:pyrroline-5-carboxylate reductase [Coniella lustricola]|uniref:Pyrroline-5-carboxylate reductase n=1 Tax=Coniella lustricola TaxID=2025994 RepID=A0A2T2ZXU2_9PEZI|nr:pyrroline-5-carboxylate reductase [Coniella lustricola]
MAAAIISGLVATTFTTPASQQSQLCVSEPWDVNRAKMDALGVRTTISNVEAARGADVLIIAVKPQVARDVCRELAASWGSSSSSSSSTTAAEKGPDEEEGEPQAKRAKVADSSATPSASNDQNKLPLVVSIAAGITAASLRKWTTTADGRAPPIVRVMPNTPALLGEGASGVYADAEVSEAQREQVAALLGSVSKVTEWVDREELLDVVTGLSGSGPAYFFALVEHLITSATALGLSEEQATRLAKQTCLGAGKMLVDASSSSSSSDPPPTPAQLRKNVTSPNGTTDAALKSFAASGFEQVVDRAVKAATDRAAELGATLGAE